MLLAWKLNIDKWRKNELYANTKIMCKVLKPIGYHDDHEIGEVIPVEARHVNDMIRDGYVEIDFVPVDMEVGNPVHIVNVEKAIADYDLF